MPRPFHLRFLEGRHAIGQAQQLLRELAMRSGQPEAVDDIPYYLEKPGLLDRTPILALVYCDSRGPQHEAAHPEESSEELEGAVLLFRYRVAGVRIGLFTSNDRSGRRNVIAPAPLRWKVAKAVTDFLHLRGAHVVMLSFRCDLDHQTPERCCFESAARGSRIERWRTIPDYLALQPSLDATLAQMGKRTRTHMRYYRKRAQELLGCIFDPQLQIDAPALLDLNRRCTHPLRKEVATWRLRALAAFPDPILMGLRDKAGDLLCVVGGRRLGDQTEILWQMNRGDLRGHSLSLVMRSHLIEHEIGRGVRRLYLDGGTAHSVGHSFVRATVTDVAVLRRSALTLALRKSARLLIPWDNELAHLLVATSSDIPGAIAEKELIPAGERAEEPVLSCSR